MKSPNGICRHDCKRDCVMSGAESAWAFLITICYQQFHTFHDSSQISFWDGGKLVLLQMKLRKRWLLYPKTCVGPSTLGSRWKAHFPLGLRSMFTLKLLISVPLDDDEKSWCANRFVDAGVAGIQHLAILGNVNADQRQAGWIKQTSSTTPADKEKALMLFGGNGYSDWGTGSLELCSSSH